MNKGFTQVTHTYSKGISKVFSETRREKNGNLTCSSLVLWSSSAVVAV